jgi:hypothetical protein
MRRGGAGLQRCSSSSKYVYDHHCTVLFFAVGIHSIGHTVHLEEGDTIHLPCLHISYPMTNVEIDWFKDKGQNIRHSEARAQGRLYIRREYLELKNVGTEDSGNYSCQVKAWQSEERDAITYNVIVQSMLCYPNTYYICIIISSPR